VKFLERADSLWIAAPARRLRATGDGRRGRTLGFYLLDDAGLRTLSSGAQINTDDRTLLEYHAPRSLLVHGLEDKNRDEIRRSRKIPCPDFPPDSRDRTLTASAVTSVNQEDADAPTAFAGPRQSSGNSRDRYHPRARRAGLCSNFQNAFRAFDAALAMDPNFLGSRMGPGRNRPAPGNNQKAREALQRILVRKPDICGRSIRL
jgi:hypothetical protein